MAKKKVYVFTCNLSGEQTKFYNWNECQAYIKKNKGTVKGFKTEEEANAFLSDKKVVGKKQSFYGFKAVDSRYSKIFDTWDEILKYSKEHKGIYKKFKTEEEAKEFISEVDPLYYKNANNYPKDALNCYVDGSFSKELNNYSFGLVCEKNGKVVFYDKGVGTNEEAVSMQQIGGELLGAIKALLFARKENIKKIVIFFDYKGVCYHALGYWKPKSEFSKIYYDWMQEFFKTNPDIEVFFCKVDAHTGDDFNEVADSLAKSALGIEVEKKNKELCEKYDVKI